MKFSATTPYIAQDLVIWFGLLRKYFSITGGKFKLWARLLLCTLFMLGGANFSHGDQLHHQSSGSPSDHHLKIDDRTPAPISSPHEHFEQTDRNVLENDLTVHCGAPELQPNSVALCYSTDLDDTIKPLPDLQHASWTNAMDPPPPRS